MRATTFLRIIRWPNLLLVLVIQGIGYDFLLDHRVSSLSLSDFLQLSLVTTILAASGYVINDYYDGRMDRINKPDRWIAGNIWSLEQVLWIYRVLIGVGAIAAVVLAVRIAFLQYLILYPLAAGGLWLYSYTLKCKPVIGNLWVALFAAGVLWIVVFPDYLNGHPEAIRSAVWHYGFFAFFTTWYREIIKDLEDLSGDTAAGCHTFAVLYGIRPAKIMAVVICVVQIIGLLVWESTLESNHLQLIFTILEGAMVASAALVWWAKDVQYFSKASMIVKGVMLAGTLLLFVL